MKKLKENEYMCANCRETFTKGWTDEEALKEAGALWNKEDLDAGSVVVCDDCFNDLIKHKDEWTSKKTS